jgi:rod shape-determining protein MreD
MPAGAVFASGLAMDVLTYGPLGFWSLVYLAGFGVASRRWGRGEEEAEGSASLAGLVCVVALASAVAWAGSSLYFVRLMDWRPMALAGVAAAIAYPLVALALGPVARFIDGRRIPRLYRRG